MIKQNKLPENALKVHKVLKKGEMVKRHNHLGYTVYVQVLEGLLKLDISGVLCEISKDEVAKFRGEEFVELTAIKDSKFTVHLESNKNER